jgi:pyruvate formate lyase activating enzyme
VWLEVTTLVIPTLSDSEAMLEKIAKFVKNKLGDSVPWHVSAFSGEISWKLRHLPQTTSEKIKKAYEIGKSTGLKYVYAGNVPGSDLENTYCPKCNNLVIRRTHYHIERLDNRGKCRKCGENIEISN